MRHLPLLATLALLATAAACSSSDDPRPGPSDSGVPDAGPAAPDGGPPAPLPDRTACSGLTVGPGTYEWTVVHDSRTRAYRVRVPPGYDATRPTPVVLAFHGFGSSELQMEGLTGLSTLADAEGFIAVYPRGLNFPDIYGGSDPVPTGSRSWNGGACCPPARGANVDDVGFVDALLADLDTRVCVDPRRLYATGFSNGAFLSYRLACERAGHFAAIAPVAGTEGISPCAPTRPVPVLHVHGTADATILYDGGSNIPLGGPYPGAAETVRRWAERNGCTGPAQETYRLGDVTCITATGCAPESASAVLCTVEGGEHAWPGYPFFNNGTRNLDATREAWRFFRDRPRP